jgi:hypothetical protein
LVIISSESICPIVLECGKTQSKPVKTWSAYLAEILLTSQEWTSDSCTNIFFLRIFDANTTGKATYHHLQNTTSILCL